MKTLRLACWVALLAALALAIACGPSTSPEAEEAEVASKGADPTSEQPKEEETEPVTGPPVVNIKTTKGTIKIELLAEQAPKTVANFLKNVDRKYFDHTIFHRVIKNDIIQGGGYTWDMKTFNLKRKWPVEPVDNESENGLKNVRGAVSMARGSEPHGATSQFFINLKTNRRLDRDHPRGDGWGYCVFGQVIEGMDVVDKIGAVKTASKDGQKDVPVRPVFISWVKRPL